jgi:Mg/Co/Ni transporter MgtE
VPTCSLDEAVADVVARQPDRWDICIVTNDHHVVLGLLGRSALRADQQATVEKAMTSGPSTIRPSARVDAVRQRMREQNLTRIIVSRADGVLVGVLCVEDLDARTGTSFWPGSSVADV